MKTTLKSYLFAVVAISLSAAQRSPYAGGRPQGYKDKYTPQTAEVIANRFGEQSQAAAATGQQLPHAAHGDATYVQLLNSLPIDRRPFWFVNYQAIEAAQQQPFPIVRPATGPAPFAGSG